MVYTNVIYHCINFTWSAEHMLNSMTDTVITYVYAWSALDTAVSTHSRTVFGEYTVIHTPTTAPTHIVVVCPPTCITEKVCGGG